MVASSLHSASIFRTLPTARRGWVQSNLTAGRTMATEAQQAALDYLGEQAPGIVADVAADQTTVVVRVERDVPLAFLRIIRINVTHIRATATAEMRHGVASGGR